MDGKGQVVEANSRLLGIRVSGGILLPDYRRIEEGRGIDCVTNESQDINCREIDGQSDSRTATEVLDWLRIERRRPAESTDK